MAAKKLMNKNAGYFQEIHGGDTEGCHLPFPGSVSSPQSSKIKK